MEAAFWLVRPDDHTIWAVHVCVKIGGSSYFDWSSVGRKRGIHGPAANCYDVHTSFTAAGGCFRRSGHGQFLEPAELDAAANLVLSVQNFRPWGLDLAGE
jgi:hypothetical protein